MGHINDQLARAAGPGSTATAALSWTPAAGPQTPGSWPRATAPHAAGSLLRLESVQNATEQGESAAAALLGQDRPFTATPWFWSDQYDKKLQMAGLSTGADHWAVRGDMAAGSFSVYHFKGERLLAVDSVSASKNHLQARELLDAGKSPTPAQAADTAFDLASLLA